MNPRPYQTDAIRRTEEAFRQSPSTLLVLATGLGKTVIFSHIAHRWGAGRVLVIAHRDELIRQAAEKIEAVSGEKAAIEMGPERASDAPWMKSKVVVSSVQTMCKPGRQKSFDAGEFGLVVVDEAHHAVASTYRSVLDYFSGSKVLGVTATPKRSDELAMGQIFETVAYEYGIEAAVMDGWLVPVRQKVIRCEELDFSSVRTTAGDFNEADLEAVLAEEKAVHAVAAPLAEAAGDLPTLVFCVTIKHAQKMAEVLNRYKAGSAKALSGNDDRTERRAWVERFKNRGVQFLCSCMLFTEGFDAPETAVVAMARPTKSLPLYVQVLGRGTRPLPGVVDPFAEHPAEARRQAIADSRKPYMLALDFVGNSGRHKIVTSYDVLGGKYGEPVRAQARKNSEEDGDARPVELALEEAAGDVEFMAAVESESERLKRVKARARWQQREVSPFADGSVGAYRPGPKMGATMTAGEPCSDKQAGYICYLSKTGGGGWTFDKAKGLSKKQAAAVISKLQQGQGS